MRAALLLDEALETSRNTQKLQKHACMPKNDAKFEFYAKKLPLTWFYVSLSRALVFWHFGVCYYFGLYYEISDFQSNFLKPTRHACEPPIRTPLHTYIHAESIREIGSKMTCSRGVLCYHRFHKCVCGACTAKIKEKIQASNSDQLDYATHPFTRKIRVHN